MRSRPAMFVLLSLVVVVCIAGTSACTRAKPNRLAAQPPTAAVTVVRATAPGAVAPAVTASNPSPIALAMANSSTNTNLISIPLEPSPTPVPGMPTPTVGPAAALQPEGTVEPTPAVTLVIPLTPQVEPLATVEGRTKVYKVKQSDTLFSIAIRFGTTVDTLKELNNLTNDLLSVGQELLVPVVPDVTPEPEEKPVVPTVAVQRPATGGPAVPGQLGGVPSNPYGRYHIVQPGENLFRIALKYGVSLDALAQANDIMAPWYTIYVGQRLVIP